jgi:hypothetical protein
MYFPASHPPIETRSVSEGPLRHTWQERESWLNDIPDASGCLNGQNHWLAFIGASCKYFRDQNALSHHRWAMNDRYCRLVEHEGLNRILVTRSVTEMCRSLQV